jgi:hypothetical protein
MSLLELSKFIDIPSIVQISRLIVDILRVYNFLG